MTDTYHCATPGDGSSSGPHTGKDNAAKTAVSYLLQHLEPVLESHVVCWVGRSPVRYVVCDGHVDGKTRTCSVFGIPKLLRISACRPSVVSNSQS